MNKNSLKKGLLALTLGLTFSSQSMATGIPVFDVSNFTKTTVTAIEQVKQTAHQAAIYAQEVKQYENMVQNLKQLNPSVIQQGVDRGFIPPGNYSTTTDVANAAKGVYGTYQGIGNNMNGYSTSYNGIKTLMNDIDRTSISSRVSSDKILQYDFQRSQQGIQNDTNYYNSLKDLNAQLAQHQKRTDALAASLPAQNGTVQLLQTIASQNTVMSDQMTHLIQVISVNAGKTVENSLDQQEKKEKEVRAKDSARNMDSAAKTYFSIKK